MESYNFQKIEKKWQEKWKEEGIYKTKEDKDRPKYYVLDMFPYPSGAGLHVGHPKGYIATDITARMKMMQGYNVLHPMGWDAFGLPAENYAIKNKVHPKEGTDKNVATFKKQLEQLGFTYDWDREVNTTDPKYYKWTQWTFLQMFNKGLAYESNEPVNWCPSCKTVLANEDLENGRCERCDSEIEQKPLRQWVLRITDYADRMLEDLDKLNDWPDAIKEMQRNWIGKSVGTNVSFDIKDSEHKIEVFTTRVDTLFSGTFLIFAPEHPFIKEITTKEQKDAVEEYLQETIKKSDLERTELLKEKTGVFTGAYAINPANGEEIQIWISDFVLANYGTGAVFADAHDERDFEMAKKFDIPLAVSIRPEDDKEWEKVKNLEVCYPDDGVLVNSGDFDGLSSTEARVKITEWLESNGKGSKAVNYKLRDWVFSRQRYWGEPIPVVHCDSCGVVGVPEEELPVELPDVESYEPTGTGESPLATIDEWVNTKCPKCGGPAKRETNTMPQWAGSCWYYLRYIDPHNDNALVDKDKEKYWSPIDFYVGGAEHATRHLIYARFWHKFLYDIGVVSYDEPFTRLQHVGLVMAEDGRKMSKRWGNVINPDEVVASHGADSMRVYEMFMGPFAQSCAWSTSGLNGAKKFLEKIINLSEKNLTDVKCDGSAKNNDLPEGMLYQLHKTIKKVGEDIEKFHFNTGISQMMILINFLTKFDTLPKEGIEALLRLLAPFAPHLSEELWEKIGNKESIFKESWPEYDPELIVEDVVEMVVQVNGKVRDKVEVSSEIADDELEKIALEREKIKKYTKGKEIRKVIIVKSKIVNIVV